MIPHFHSVKGRSGTRMPTYEKPSLEALEERVVPTNFLVTNTADTGSGSLRQAILDANKDKITDSITFQIFSLGVPRISPQSALPALLDPVTIDGTTQAQGLIELYGAGAGANVNGLAITANNSAVRGLVVNQFSANGILITGANDSVTHCRIGTDVTATVAAPNFLAGIAISGSISGNHIGGSTAADRNIISGNRLEGITTDSSTFGNVIDGNYIGTDASGTVALGNDIGLFIQGANNIIGGVDATHRNLISANSTTGISVGGQGNTVEANFIGTDVTGMSALGNGITGVAVGGIGNNIGTLGIDARNVISGNGQSGVDGAGANFVRNNLIGTDVTGTAAVPNGFAGINIDNASGLTVGGLAASYRNIISGNHLYGIFIRGTGGVATQNVIEGSYIGLDITGGYPLGNGVAGVWIQNASGNTIGGTSIGARNVITGNNQENVHIVSDTGAGSNLILGNYVGLDANGAVSFASSAGIHLVGTVNNIIGGTSPAARNIITGCSQGIAIEDFDPTSPSTGNQILGNWIGTDGSGTAGTGNLQDGILLDGAGGNMIGGTAPGAGNTIAFNNRNGVTVNTGTGNSILGNSIHSNIGLGIDLAPLAVNPNDALDADLGANNGQNYPVVTAAIARPGQILVRGNLSSAPSASFHIEFFATSAANASGFGEGEAFLGATSVLTNANGIATFSTSLSAMVAPGQAITATATSDSGDTSEFSAAAATVRGFAPLAVTGPGLGQESEVKVFNAETGQRLMDFDAYEPAFRGGVRVATGDFNGDGVLDFITAPGGVNVTLVRVNGILTPSFDFSAGRAPEIKVFSGTDGHLLSDFMAYDPSFKAGLFIAVADVNGDGKPDIITAPDATGQSGHTNVRVFFNGNNTGIPDREFSAYDPGFGGGVRLSAADMNGDGFADIITGPGIWSGPDVRIFDGKKLAQNSTVSLAGEFLAYDFRYFGGVFVAAGDVNGDGKPDIVTGTNGNGGPEVKAYDGKTALGNPTPAILDDFFAYGPAFNGGASVAALDVNNDGKADILTGAGPGGGPHVRIFDGATGQPLFDAFDSFYAYDPSFTGGVYVGGA